MRAWRPAVRQELGAFLVQMIEMLADMGGLGRRVGQGNRPVEGLAGLGAAVELLQQGTPHTVEIEVAGKPFVQRLDHRQAAAGPRILFTATARLSVTTGEGCSLSRLA